MSQVAGSTQLLVNTQTQNCSTAKTCNAIAVAVGVIMALAGIFALLAVAYPNVMGPFNAMSCLINIGGAVLLITGSVIVTIALVYLCKKSVSTTSSSISILTEPVKHTIELLANQIKHEFTDASTAKAHLSAFLGKHYKNPQAMQYFVSRFSDAASTFFLLDLLYENFDLILGNKSKDCRFNKSILDAIRSQPVIFDQLIQEYNQSVNNKDRFFPWIFLHDLSDEEIKVLLKIFYINVDGVALTQHLVCQLCCLSVCMHAKELARLECKPQMLNDLYFSVSDIKKLYSAIIDNFAGIQIQEGKMIDFGLMIRGAVKELQDKQDETASKQAQWLMEDFEAYFPDGWEEKCAQEADWLAETPCS